MAAKLEKEVRQKNRTQLQIVTEILDKCRKPQTKTSIMYNLGLSYKMMKDYLHELLKAKLIEVLSSSKTMYATTQKD